MKTAILHAINSVSFMTVDYALLALGFFAFCGGLIDAAVGGGGLIQVPALLHALPQYSLATVFGTNKLAVLAGTLTSTLRYARNIRIKWKLVAPMSLSALASSYLGAYSVSIIPKILMEYVVFSLLITMATYTFFKKDFGHVDRNLDLTTRTVLLGTVLGGAIGFYDGIFGPGSGSLLLFVFVRFFGFDFLNASVSAKLVNVGTFGAALVFFISSGNVLWMIGGLVAACNIAGSVTGVFLALRYGSGLIRTLFLLILVFLIGRLGVSLFL